MKICAGAHESLTWRSSFRRPPMSALKYNMQITDHRMEPPGAVEAAGYSDVARGRVHHDVLLLDSVVTDDKVIYVSRSSHCQHVHSTVTAHAGRNGARRKIKQLKGRFALYSHPFRGPAQVGPAWRSRTSKQKAYERPAADKPRAQRRFEPSHALSDRAGLETSMNLYSCWSVTHPKKYLRTKTVCAMQHASSRTGLRTRPLEAVAHCESELGGPAIGWQAR